MRWFLGLTVAAALTGAASVAELEKARDRQDRPALERLAGEFTAAAEKSPRDGGALYQAALAHSFVAQVAIEVRDRNRAREAAEAGIHLAQQAVALAPRNGEYHRVLGTLCGQAVRDLVSGMKWGRCAQEEIGKAMELDPKSAMVHVSRGVGSYYLPPMLGGNVENAIKDFENAIQLNPNLADAHLWLGIALRKANRQAEARKAIARSLELNPNRTWARQQLEKTPKQ